MGLQAFVVATGLASIGALTAALFRYVRGRAVVPLRRRRRGVPWSGLGVCGAACGAFVLAALLTDAMLPHPAAPLERLQRVCLERGWLLLLLVGATWVVSAGAVRPRHLGLHANGLGVDVAVGLGGALAVLGPVYLCALPVHAWRSVQPHPLLEMLRTSGSGSELLLIGLSAVVLAPLVEELLFRVLIQGTLAARFRGWLPLAGSSLLFCAVHPAVDWLPLFPLAAGLGYVYHRRQSLAACVVMHAAFNTLSLAATILSANDTPNV